MAKKKAVVITFGRFQPPTIGHEKLIGAVIAHANKIGAEHRIYASQSYDGGRPRAAIKNPLQYKDKIRFMRQMFPKANIVVGDDDTNTFMRVLYELQKEGYTTVHVVVGDDRVPEIKKTVQQYLDSDDPETGLDFDEFKVVSAGKRDPEAEGVEGMSASKLRAAAAADDFKLFKQGMPKGFGKARELFDAIRKGLERPMKPEKKTKKSKVNEELLNEVTPPDEKSERLVKKAKASFKDRYGDDWASYLYGVAWKQYNKRHGIKTKTRLGEPVEEAVLHEGGVKASLEDWLEGLPKKVVQELMTKFGKELKKSHFAGSFAVSDPVREKIRQVLIRNRVKPLLGDKNQAEGTSAVIMSFWTFHGPVDELGVNEGTLHEGGVKGALEDWMYSIPKEAIEELRQVMKIKSLQKRFAMINKTLKKHGVEPNQMKLLGSGAANVINDYYDTFFGESYMQESINEATINIPRDARIKDTDIQNKTVTLTWYDPDKDEWNEEEVPMDEVPGFYDRAADKLRIGKTDRFGNVKNPPKASQIKKTEKTAQANMKTADELVQLFKQKPMKTPITIYGKKWGKGEDYEIVVMKRLYQGSEVYVVKSSGRFVELRPTGAGLQIVDVKTKKILLDKGNDATW